MRESAIGRFCRKNRWAVKAERPMFSAGPALFNRLIPRGPADDSVRIVQAKTGHPLFPELMAELDQI
jgi:hypothetical protein